MEGTKSVHAQVVLEPFVGCVLVYLSIGDAKLLVCSSESTRNRKENEEEEEEESGRLTEQEREKTKKKALANKMFLKHPCDFFSLSL